MSIATTVDFCRNIPHEPFVKISRDHLLEEVKRTLHGRAEIVMLVGESLTGKSEFVAEYFRRQPENCIAIFLNPESGMFRSTEYIRLTVTEQISWIVDNKQLDVAVVTEEIYRKYLYKLQKYARHNKITWVVDGLGQKKNIDPKELLELTEVIPLGTRDFDFIITSEYDLLPQINTGNRIGKVMEAVLVSPDEARQFFSDLIPDEKDVQEIRSFCLSSVGRMQRIMALLHQGIKIDELLEKGSGSLDEIFEFEWRLIPSNADLHMLLAVLAFASQAYSINKTSKITGLSKENIEALIPTCRFISTSTDCDETYLAIDSKSLKAFITRKLNILEPQVRQAVIADLLDNSDSAETTQFLPLHLSAAGRNEELLDRLDAAHFACLLKTERSLKSLRQHAAFGYDAARKIGDQGSEIAFSLISSVVTGLTFSVGTVEQIDVLVQMNHQDFAFEIASIAPTAEERFRLMASAAKAIARQGRTITQDIRDLLKQLAAEADVASLGDLGVDIATDLTSVDIKLADSVLKKVQEHARRNLSLPNQQSVDSVKDGLCSLDKRTEEFNLSGLSEEKMQGYASEVARHINKTNGASLLEMIRNEEPELALLLATQWLYGNRSNIDAYKVADSALDFLLATSTRTPKLDDLRQIAMVLPSLKPEECKRLAARLEAQFRVIGHHGTTVESIRLQMSILRARYEEDPTSSVELALIDIHSEIHGLKDLSIRATCWAWFLNHLHAFTNIEVLEENTGLAKDAFVRLEETVNVLLSLSADHFVAAKDAIQAIAHSDPQRAFQLISRLNTRDSRNLAYQILAQTLVHRKQKANEVVIHCIASISEDMMRDELGIQILKIILSSMGADSNTWVSKEFLEIWKSIEFASYKMQAIAATYVIARQMDWSSEAAELKPFLDEVWLQVHSSTTRVHLGYMVASEVVNVDKILAQEWIDKVKILENNSIAIASRPVTLALNSTVQLAIRLFPAICMKNVHFDENVDFRRLEFLIISINDIELQIRLWTDLAIRMHFNGSIDYVQFICEQRIAPILDSDHSHNGHHKDLLIYFACPAIFIFHQGTAMHRIESIGNVELRDQSRRQIVKMLLRGVPPQEPDSSLEDHVYPLTQSTVIDILTLLKQCKTDSYIYAITQDLCTSLASEKNSSKIQRNAANDYLQKIENIVKSSLPDQENIKHRGFLISCQAFILKAQNAVRKDSVPHASGEWERLFLEARALANIADRSVVTAIVGVNAKAKPESIVRDWLKVVRSDILLIPTALDRLNRYVWIAEIVERIDKAAAKMLISDGITLSNLVPQSENLADHQRRLLDLAHSLDATLANDFLEKLDVDEARREPLKKRLELNNKRKALASQPNSRDIDGLEDAQLTDLCQRNLASLVGGRIPVKPIEDFMELNRRARSMAVNDAYVIWAWILENSVRKNSKSSGDKLCRKLFEATCKASEIAHALIGRIAQSTLPAISHGTIKGGERSIFLTKIAEWAAGNDGQRICITDPYFGPNEIDVIKLIAEAAPRSTIRVLTSREHIKKKKLDMVEDSFRDAWGLLSDVEAPNAQIGVVGYGSEGKHPIHDRWIVSSDSGLSLGSSIGSIGMVRMSDVSKLSAGDATNKSAEINVFFESPPRHFDQQRLMISSFNL